LEALLAGRVPDLHAVLDSTEADSLEFEVHPDGGSIALVESILTEPGDQVALPHSAIPDNDHLHQHAFLFKHHTQ
jgi:hypothetical protein